VTSADVSAIDPRNEEHAGEQHRWDRWQKRYARSSRRTSIQAHIVAAILLGGIALLLLMQFLATSRVSTRHDVDLAGSAITWIAYGPGARSTALRHKPYVRPIQVDEQFTTTKDTTDDDYGRNGSVTFSIGVRLKVSSRSRHANSL